ncbi:MAG: hypothetical protein NW216_03345 [Hyphomicrobium sp.]|nr:hypothetical protein [Hyphomicrobium sp.]
MPGSDDSARRHREAERGQTAGSKQLADPLDPHKAERLGYLADMILELTDMAKRDGHVTLAGLLSLAHLETLQRRRMR